MSSRKVQRKMSDIFDKFSWGQVVETYKIEGYTIKKYHPYIRMNQTRAYFESQSSNRATDKKATLYHIYVDGKDTNVSTKTLEGAMLVAISVKTLGNHVPGLSMIARALNIKDEL